MIADNLKNSVFNLCSQVSGAWAAVIEDFKVKDSFVEVPRKPGLGSEVDESIFK